jgi:hypothetical protein
MQASSKILTAIAIAAFAVATPLNLTLQNGLKSSAAFARGGADDGAAHDANDDRGGHAEKGDDHGGGHEAHDRN